MREQPSISPRALKAVALLAMLWAVGITLACLLDPWRLPAKEPRDALIGRLHAVAHEEFAGRRAAEERAESLALQLLSEQRENAGLRRVLNDCIARLPDPEQEHTEQLNELRGRAGQ